VEPGELRSLSLLLAPVLGAVAGSFCNVVIRRLPEGKSVVLPGSACGACGKPIRWYDNLPIASYFLLRGRCRDCGAPFSPQYALIEAVTAALFFVCCYRFGLSAQLALALLIVSVAVVVAGIDFNTGLILDVISYPFLAAALLLALTGLTVTIASAAAGAVVGAGILAAMNLIWKEGMGWGDVKYMAGLGAFFGLGGVIFLVVVSSLIGSAAGIVLVTRRKKGMRDRIPFGPAIAAGSVLTVFFGDAFVAFLFG